MTTTLFLGDEELREITHYKQPAAQARFLRRMRVPFRRRADGSLLVGRTAMDRAMLTDAETPSTEQPTPDQSDDTTGLQWSASA